MSVALRTALCIACAALAVSPAWADALGPTAEELAAGIRAPEGWDAQPVIVYPADRVFEKIDGRDQTYQSFGLVCMANAIFDSPDGADGVDLEIYDMGSPERALGVFAQQHRGPKAEYCDIEGAEATNLALQLAGWKDRFYIRIDRMNRKAAAADEGALLVQVAAQVCAAIPEAPTGAELVAPLPDEGRVDHSAAYTMGSYMGYSGLADVRHARYASDERVVTLFVLSPEDPEGALNSVAAVEDAETALENVGDGGITFVRDYIGAICIVRVGAYLVGSVDEDGDEEAGVPKALNALIEALD